jgi:hypothetical protein
MQDMDSQLAHHSSSWCIHGPFSHACWLSSIPLHNPLTRHACCVPAPDAGALCCYVLPGLDRSGLDKVFDTSDIIEDADIAAAPSAPRGSPAGKKGAAAAAEQLAGLNALQRSRLKRKQRPGAKVGQGDQGGG